MNSKDTTTARARGRMIRILLSALVVSFISAVPAWAVDCVADRGGIIDGFVDPNPPSQIQIDGNCTIRNFPASNPLTSNISFYTQPGGNPLRWLVIFDNVVHTGQMSCNAVQGHKIWFTNGSSSGIHANCQNLLIPVEKIDKRNPPGPATATIGVPFTWTMTIPVLYDPATGSVINTSGSVNDLHSITVWDDLNTTGASLTYVSHNAYWLGSGAPVPHTFSNVNGFLTFDNIPVVGAGEQFVIELTVVLDNTPANAPGTSFFNTAKWDFGRLIDNVFYEPLPGEWGVTPPMVIAAPDLVVTKTGPATMNLGQWGQFDIDAWNNGRIDAWDVHLRDLLPDGAAGGMCDRPPEILSAQVFQSNGTTPVPGKGPLTQGVDYQFSWSGAPGCQLDLHMLTPEAAIGPDERLIVGYRTQLDAGKQNGVTLTNVAGAVEWFNGGSSVTSRQQYTRALTNGTPTIADHEDDHTVAVALSGYFFEKTVQNLTTGTNPTTTASPGEVLRYTLRFQATDQPLPSFSIEDELDALNAPAAFEPGSLTLVSWPSGADISGTSATGGANGTGILDVGNLSLATGEELQIQFDVRLSTSLVNGMVVSNQSAVRLPNGSVFALSDDPAVNGTADPAIPGDEDPTRVTIVASPVFLIQKISTDLTGDPAVLLAGETLRYTITVKNIGNQDATDATLRDAVPVNTTYVAGSTTLNGAPVADVGGVSPLVNGMPIHSPADPVPGSMPADPSSSTANVATITFDVIVSPTVVNGTIISNQGFVSAVGSGIIDRPSDDPATPIMDDPTLDVVGNFPVLYAEKSVVLSNDLGTPGIVDPGDTLRYSITVQNSAAIPATGVVLTDSVPANTAYVANTTFLNGLPVGQPDGGVPPLASGIDISSSDLTPPLPGAGGGTISPGESATLQFDLRVDPNTPVGTLISNQAVVSSVELSDLLTDGDGDPSTGPEPTVVVVGAVQQLSITKQVTVVGGGPALAGSQLEYVVRVENFGAVPALNVVITDDLDAPVAGQLSLVGGSATMNGSTSGVTVSGSTISASYATAYGPLDPGEVVILRFRATLDPGLTQGTTVTNTGVVAWSNPTQTASASVSIIVGAIPGVSELSGSAWHDADFDAARGSGERALSGWTVELYRDGLLVHSTPTDGNGDYRITGVQPNDVNGSQYELRFSAPGAGPATAKLGLASSPFTNGMQSITSILVPPGASLQGLNLPIQPNGVVYNSITRAPIAGATLTLMNAASASPVPAACLDDAAQQGQVTLADGYYKFDVNFSDTACPSGGDYVIDVTPPPGSGYVGGYSQIIPPMSGPLTAAFSVPGCMGSPDDVIPSTGSYCEVQPSEFAPSASVPARSTGTVHHVHLTLNDNQPPGTSEIFNNHIALDAVITGSIAITKTTPLINVSRGQMVPYAITVSNLAGTLLTDVSIVDRMPAGFTYIEGSALLDGNPSEPVIDGRRLSWDSLVFAGTETRTVKLLLAVGGGVSEGEYVNHAQLVSTLTGNAISGEASATVRLLPDPTFDCSDVTGKVWNDVDRDGVQDEGEEGLAGVRLATPRGLQATTDQHGRYHITCAITPHEGRGSNFVLKLDDRTLPSGFRMSTDQVLIRRATRGKALKMNFGASIFRVVAIDLSDAVFEPGSTAIRVQWRPRLDLLLEELRKAPSVLRLSYIADTEDASLVERRLEAVKSQLTDAWESSEGPDPLIIEPEVFWRRGAPPGRRELQSWEGR